MTVYTNNDLQKFKNHGYDIFIKKSVLKNIDYDKNKIKNIIKDITNLIENY